MKTSLNDINKEYQAMNVKLTPSIKILERTPAVLKTLLQNLDETFVHVNEGAGTWSPYDVVGHLIVCEKINFMERIRVLLSDQENKVFHPIDMTAQFEFSKDKSIEDLLKEFEQLRNANLMELKSVNMTEGNMTRQAMHSKIGAVTVMNVFSTWVAHDLTHIGQISRVMAKQYQEDIGPFIQYLTRLN